MKLKQALIALGALAQETRLAAFRHLVVAGPKGASAGTLAGTLKIAASTLSFHLKELEHAGLVTQHRESRNVIYTVNYSGMRDLLAFLMEDCCGKHPEICTIEIRNCCAA
jgi:ArsR family transcriptional regulator, arsenate/arsenite/antimonite-responsive transcriptional repressor